MQKYILIYHNDFYHHDSPIETFPFMCKESFLRNIETGKVYYCDDMSEEEIFMFDNLFDKLGLSDFVSGEYIMIQEIHDHIFEVIE